MTDKYVRQILRYLVGDGSPVVAANSSGNLFERLEALLTNLSSGDSTEVTKLNSILAKLGTPAGDSISADLANIFAEANKMGNFTDTNLSDQIDLIVSYLLSMVGSSTSEIATSGTNTTIVNSYRPWTAKAHIGSVVKFSIPSVLGVNVDYTRFIVDNTEDTIYFTPRLPGSGAISYIGTIDGFCVKVKTVTESDATNDYTIEAVAGVGNNVPLSAAFADDVLTITLATDGAGAVDAAANTQALVAAVIDALADFTAEAIGAGGSLEASVIPWTFTGGLTPITVPDATSFYIIEDSNWYLSNRGYQHIHNPAKCYPTLAAGVTLTGHANAWTLGNKTEIIPANAITKAFDIHFVNVEGASATDVYELVLYKGAIAGEEEIARVRTHKNSVQSGANNVPIQIAPLPANTRVSAAIASAGGGGDTMTVSLFYHEYV